MKSKRPPMLPDTVSILGCGWLGRALANTLHAQNVAVRASVTTEEKAEALRSTGLDAHVVTFDPAGPRSAPNGPLTTLLDADALVIAIPPRAARHGEDFYPAAMQALADAIRNSNVAPRHIILISSTSVYLDLNREVVEEDVTEPEHSAAPALVRGEQALLALAKNSLPHAGEVVPIVTVLRCGGLMGYDRIPGKYAGTQPRHDGNVPVNYVHRDDVVGVITTLLTRPIGGTFNVVALEHPTRQAVMTTTCQQFGYRVPHFLSPTQSLSFKIISAQRLCQQVGYVYTYPDPQTFLYTIT